MMIFIELTSHGSSKKIVVQLNKVIHMDQYQEAEGASSNYTILDVGFERYIYVQESIDEILRRTPVESVLRV